MTSPKHLDLQAAIAAAWERRAELTPSSKGAERDAVEAALELLDSGAARVAEPGAEGWTVHQWLKQAVLLSFRLYANAPLDGAGGAPVFDKVAMKFADGVPAASENPAFARCRVRWSAVPPLSLPAWC